MLDNASNNDTLVEDFERRCHDEGIPFSARDARMRCFPHTAHLAALKVLHSNLCLCHPAHQFYIAA